MRRILSGKRRRKYNSAKSFVKEIIEELTTEKQRTQRKRKQRFSQLLQGLLYDENQSAN
jgi:polyhydroxyalkanoate synthesis regulator phasin